MNNLPPTVWIWLICSLAWPIAIYCEIKDRRNEKKGS